MNEDVLKALCESTLARAADAPREECPEPDALRAIVEAVASEAERLETMDHVAGCPACQRELALLGQVATAKPRALRVAPAWMAAAAATVVLAVFGLRAARERTPLAPVMRGNEATVTLLSPSGSVDRLAAGSLVWGAVAGATRYEVEVLDPDGALAYSATVRDTVAALSSQLASSVAYRWRVSAVRADGSRLESGVSSFTIGSN
jgi:hypothetical protein